MHTRNHGVGQVGGEGQEGHGGAGIVSNLLFFLYIGDIPKLLGERSDEVL